MNIGDEIENYSQDIRFTLGYAGTGKSTLLAKEVTPTTIVLTPTHKAKDVLKSKGVDNVFTIHSVMKLVPTIDQNFRKKGKMQRLQRIGDVDLKSINKVIIDEFSMIPTFIMDMLLDMLPADAEVSIYGDPYQLPPVDGEPVDPYWYTDEENIIILTKQHRAEAPEVVETFTRFVNYLEFPTPSADLTLNTKIKKGSLNNFNPDTDRALAYTNKEVITVNNKIANILDLPKEISIGETISINGLLGTLVKNPNLELDYPYEILTIYPKCVSKGELMSGDKLLDTIEKIEDDIEKYNQQLPNSEEFYVRIEEQVYRIYADIDHYAHSKTYKAEVEDIQLELINKHNLDHDINLPQWCKENRGDPLVRERGKAWSSFLGHQSLVWDLRRPFCTTVHKSQGSEFNTVYIAQDDIKKAIRGGHYEQYARLMYVALSRATKKVVIV